MTVLLLGFLNDHFLAVYAFMRFEVAEALGSGASAGRFRSQRTVAHRHRSMQTRLARFFAEDAIASRRSFARPGAAAGMDRRLESTADKASGSTSSGSRCSEPPELSDHRLQRRAPATRTAWGDLLSAPGRRQAAARARRWSMAQQGQILGPGQLHDRCSRRRRVLGCQSARRSQVATCEGADSPSYRTKGKALVGDVDGDGTGDRVTLRVDGPRPARCRHLLVVQLAGGQTAVATVPALPWPGADPQLLLLAEIDGRSGLEPAVALSPANVYQPGVVFTLSEGDLRPMRRERAAVAGSSTSTTNSPPEWTARAGRERSSSRTAGSPKRATAGGTSLAPSTGPRERASSTFATSCFGSRSATRRRAAGPRCGAILFSAVPAV